MKMKNPPHPGELVADNLTELGVTIKDAAEALGVTRQQLHKVISGRSADPPMLIVADTSLASPVATIRSRPMA